MQDSENGHCLEMKKVGTKIYPPYISTFVKNLPTLHFYICQKETLNNFSKNFLDIFLCLTYFLQYSSIFNNNVALNNFFSSLLDLKQNYSSFSDANYLQFF